MCRPTLVRSAVWLVLLVTLIILALSACGGGQESSSSISSAPRAKNLDGKILFTRQGGKYGYETIFTADANGTDVQRISGFGKTCCPRLSPDGTKVSWAAIAPDGKRFTAAIVRADGPNPQTMPIRDPTLNLGCSVWSPDGKQTACEGWDDSNS
jgi:Tol biopolymer transport system component